jgi:predicted Zn-dependent protease
VLYASVFRSLSAVVFVALALPGSLARAQLPAMGDGAELTAGAERQLGERIVRELYRDPDYIDDAVLAEYVQGSRCWLPPEYAANCHLSWMSDSPGKSSWGATAL